MKIFRSQIAVLALGVGIGVAAAGLYAAARADDTELRGGAAYATQELDSKPGEPPSAPDRRTLSESKVVPSTPEPNVRLPTEPANEETPEREVSTPYVANGEQRSDTRLNVEGAAYARLDEELAVVKRELRLLTERFDTLIAQRDEAQELRERRARQVDEQTLLEAGFDDEEATFIAQRHGEQQMALLELRDQAAREGWIDSERYTQEARELRNGTGSLRNDLDEETYDRFLYGTGRMNRVLVQGVIASSPAQSVGLLEGDVIVRYDGRRVFSGHDLRDAITASQDEVPAMVEVEREGVVHEFELPRGPLGIHLGAESVEP